MKRLVGLVFWPEVTDQRLFTGYSYAPRRWIARKWNTLALLAAQPGETASRWVPPNVQQCELREHALGAVSSPLSGFQHEWKMTNASDGAA